MKKCNQILADLLHGGECPFGYKCIATDCVECVKKHMEKEGVEGGKAER